MSDVGGAKMRTMIVVLGQIMKLPTVISNLAQLTNALLRSKPEF